MVIRKSLKAQGVLLLGSSFLWAQAGADQPKQPQGPPFTYCVGEFATNCRGIAKWYDCSWNNAPAEKRIDDGLCTVHDPKGDYVLPYLHRELWRVNGNTCGYHAVQVQCYQR